MNKTTEFINYMISKQKFGDSKLEDYAKEHYVPIVKRDTANLLRILVSATKPKKILEIGTAIGYSGKLMLQASEDSFLTTLEIDYDRYIFAQKTLKKFADRVEFHLCDAGDFLLNCDEKYDFVFLDGPKAQYLSYLPSILNVLNDGAIFVADNVLQEGMTAGEIPTKHKLESTIERMHKFLDIICKSKELQTTILPIGDGLSISIFKSNEKLTNKN